MVESGAQRQEMKLSKAEMVERLVGPSRKQDEEDIEYWRNASEEIRGRTLYKLLARGKLIKASVPYILEEYAPRLILKPRRHDKKE